MELEGINKENTCEVKRFIELLDETKKKLPNKEKYSQYYTPINIASYMASMFSEPNRKVIKVLDPCCGEGILVIAFLLRLLQSRNKEVKKVNVIMYEIDSELIIKLKKNINKVTKYLQSEGIQVNYKIINENFILNYREEIDFNYIIVNPPYMKLINDSQDNKRLNKLDINVTNYYAAFISLCKRLLVKNGEMVAITPRSFCNGTYYLWFRKDIISDMIFDKIHLFESRKDIFKNDDILQENIIYHCIKRKPNPGSKVKIIYSYNDSLRDNTIIERRFDEVVFPNDSKCMIRILKDNQEEEITRKINSLNYDLKSINIEVSTGPVVDFRQEKNILLKKYLKGSIPIFFSEHIAMSGINWPKEDIKKYNYMLLNDKNKSLVRKSGNYVILKRMTSKEEKRRIVSSICEGKKYNNMFVTFDNKVNYFHRNGAGLPLLIAKGLSIYLNSTIVDMYFRTFSGNTQVNVTDLRSLKYPNEETLYKLGNEYELIYINQELIDLAVENIVFNNSKS
ncbi:MAG TPA: hypothetical protein DCM59_10320 [Clostridium sp.]|nr:hypothetical protein [Clostridium sp.]